MLPDDAIHLEFNRVCLQLVTGKIPFPELTDPNVILMISRGKRPQKPRRFDVPGITAEVWTVAEKCWHEKAEERPEAKAVLQDLEWISGSGEHTESCSCF